MMDKLYKKKRKRGRNGNGRVVVKLFSPAGRLRMMISIAC